MKNAILVHGCSGKDEYFNEKYPSGSNSHWFPWLQKQLLIKGVFSQTPEMPRPYSPEYKKWSETFERFPIDEETVLVGHSCGGGFLLRWLSKNRARIKKLILVAPWLDPIKKRGGFLDFQIDFGMEKRVKEIHVLVSNDECVEGVKESVETVRSRLPSTRLHQFQKMGHFTLKDMKTEKFPKLLDLVLK